MTRVEFVKIMAYIAAAIGKSLSAESTEVYYDLLGDLPVDALQIAAKRVVLEHPWSTFPSVAELRQAASETIRGVTVELSPAEAWEEAWRACKRMDPEIEGSVDRALANVQPIVAEAIVAFGVNALVYGKEPVGVVRGQFLKIYEQLAARNKRVALLPPAVKQSIASIGQVRLEAAKMIEKIGRAVE